MFERFTERARHVVVLAEGEARAVPHDFIGCEHLLLGLLLEDDGLAAQSLLSVGLSADRVRGKLREIVPATDERQQIPFTPGAKKTLELALRESQRLEHNFIGTEHLLLGLLLTVDDEPGVARDRGAAARILEELGTKPESAREAVERLVPAVGERPGWVLRRTPGVEWRGGGLRELFSLEPEVQLRRLLARAATRAMDRDSIELQTTDLVAAFVVFPGGTELLAGHEIVPEPPGVNVAREEARTLTAGTATGERTPIAPSDSVRAMLMRAGAGALDDQRNRITLEDLLRALVRDPAGATALTEFGINPRSVRKALDQRGDPGEPPGPSA